MKILLINPPIYDFAAYDLWAKPLGLLYLSSILKKQGHEIELLDYQNDINDREKREERKEEILRNDQNDINGREKREERKEEILRNDQNDINGREEREYVGAGFKPARLSKFNFHFGCGHYLKTKIPKPPALKDIPRRYCRYGISKETAKNFLQNIFYPDIIIMTSIMTYWYPGVFEAIETAQEIFPKTKIILGGVYATLCGKHFKQQIKNYNDREKREERKEEILQNEYKKSVFSLSSFLFSNCRFSNCRFSNFHLVSGGLANLNPVFKELGIAAKIPNSFADYPAPDFSFYPNTEYAVLRLSLGCPFDCSYCAQKILCDGKFERKSTNIIFKEIEIFTKQGIENIAFYDDALLYQADTGIKPLLKKIIEAGLKIKIHTPNGLHLTYLDLELACLMKKAGFVLPRFSLETANPDLQKKTGGKIDNKGFETAVKILNEAGFGKGQFIIYLLMGIPNQSLSDIEQAIKYVHNLGGRISLSEYSIIPKTKDFANIDKKFIDEPLYHNRAVYPLFESKDWEEIYRIKLLAKELNKKL